MPSYYNIRYELKKLQFKLAYLLNFKKMDNLSIVNLRMDICHNLHVLLICWQKSAKWPNTAGIKESSNGHSEEWAPVVYQFGTVPASP